MHALFGIWWSPIVDNSWGWRTCLSEPAAVPSEKRYYESRLGILTASYPAHDEHSHRPGQTTVPMATTTMTMSASANTQSTSGENSTKSGMANRPDPSFYLTIDGLIRSHAAEDAEIPMIGYPAQGISDYEIHTAKAVDRYVDAACWWYQKQGLQPAVSAYECISLLTSDLPRTPQATTHLSSPSLHHHASTP